MNTQTEVKTQNPEVKPVVKLPELGDFGMGRYSALMGECFRDAKIVFQLSEEKADKLARQIASDFGAALSSSPVGIGRIKSVNKDGKITLSEAAKIKGVTLTSALYALMGLQYAAEAGKFGFSFGNTQWKVAKHLTEYFEKL